MAVVELVELKAEEEAPLPGGPFSPAEILDVPSQARLSPDPLPSALLVAVFEDVFEVMEGVDGLDRGLMEDEGIVVVGEVEGETEVEMAADDMCEGAIWKGRLVVMWKAEDEGVEVVEEEVEAEGGEEGGTRVEAASVAVTSVGRDSGGENDLVDIFAGPDIFNSCKNS